MVKIKAKGYRIKSLTIKQKNTEGIKENLLKKLYF
ncbi:hypothetical protein PRO82_000325 [Candidatus Protochlamydia amoebophila]|nr:hypothetical protein [Candidatus Protochlamydia amoebophila]